MRNRPQPWDIILALLTVLLTAGLVILYVNREHFFYYYDYAGFEAVTADLAHTFLKDSQSAWKLVKGSIDLDYNYLFALPVIPLIQYLGEQRLVYELGIALLYQFPYFLSLGLIASRLFPERSRQGFWITVFIAMLVPVVWAPVLRGYPDVGGAFLVALMIFIFILDDTLRSDWQVLAIGLLAALAVIFRRHFAYPVIAFYAAALTFFIIRAISPPTPSQERAAVDSCFRSRWGIFLFRCLRLLTAALISLVVMALLARTLLVRMLTVDFNALYASYQATLSLLLGYYSGLYGWFLIAMAVLGFIIALNKRLVKVPALLFISIFTAISFIAWIMVSRQVGFHYSLHLSILVVLGLAALVLGIQRINTPALRLVVLVSFLLILGANFVSSLFVPPNITAAWAQGLQKARSFSFPPLFNPDYKTVKELLVFLRTAGGPDTQVYVVDSSRNMNSDMLRLAEQKLYGREDIYLEMLNVPIVDSRDAYPLEELMRADFVVVSTPPQVHMLPENQKIVLSMHDAFFDGWEIAQDFRKLDFQPVFKDGSELSVYQRIHPTSWQAAVRAFHAFRQYIGIRPGSQPDWIYLGTQYTGVTKAPGDKNVVALRPGSSKEPMEGAFLWAQPLRVEVQPLHAEAQPLLAEAQPLLAEAQPLSAGGAITGRVVFGDMPCGDLSASIITSDSSGKVIETFSQTLTPEDDRFSLPYTADGVENLLFFLDRLDPSPETAACHVLLRWFPPEQ